MSILLQRAIASSVFTPPVYIYGNDNKTVLLINCDGSVSSTTFTDTAVGGSADTITANGSAEVIADGKFLQCCDLDGVDSYLSLAQSNDLDFGTDNFCIDFWLKLNSTPSNNDALFAEAVESSEYTDCYFTSSSNLRLRDTSHSIDSSWSPSTGTYYHVAIARLSGTAHIYIDGSRIGTGTLSDSIYPEGFNIGKGRDNQSGYIDAQIDEYRISKGTARIDDSADPLYISGGDPADGFTPPTRAYGTEA